MYFKLNSFPHLSLLLHPGQPRCWEETLALLRSSGGGWKRGNGLPLSYYFCYPSHQLCDPLLPTHVERGGPGSLQHRTSPQDPPRSYQLVLGYRGVQEVQKSGTSIGDPSPVSGYHSYTAHTAESSVIAPKSLLGGKS